MNGTARAPLTSADATEPSTFDEAPFYLRRLREEFAVRRRRNPRFSMRGFSNSLGLSAAAVSRILEQKRVPSLKTVEMLADRIQLGKSERRAFIRSSIETLHRREIDTLCTPPEVDAIENDEFSVISDWYHYAILELTFVEGFSPNPHWIARRLGIATDEASTAIRRLIRLNLLRVVTLPGGERLVKTGEKLTIRDKSKTSAFLRSFQKQILAQATESLDRTPIDERSMTSLTVAVNPERLAAARQMIQEFTRNICDLLESGPQRRVYQMSVALFPVDRGDSKDG
ncbi:MAG: DUF4423 domain-containing protein [Bdellovibrionales bacterium]|nr:DUF4423 domain-containing protein [Bdellovibrionales bacterium]